MTLLALPPADPAADLPGRPCPPWSEARRRARWLRTLVPYGTLLEAGPDGGWFLLAARRAGYAATGIGTTAGAARLAREQLGAPVLDGVFESAAPAMHPVDIVCAFHTLQHTVDPGAFLDAAYAALRPGGLLVLEVPDSGADGPRRPGSGWPALQPEYHRWHFGAETLAMVVRWHGFEVLRRDAVAFRYYLPARYRRDHARLTRTRRSDPPPRHAHPLDDERAARPRPGDLLRLVARRPRRSG